MISLKGSQIRKLGFGTYEVRSQTTHEWKYVVENGSPDGWTCTCPDFVHRHVVCEHVYSVIHFFVLRRKVFPERPSLEGKNTTNDNLCPSCNSAEIVRDGLRKTKHGQSQRYSCKVCHHRFIPPSAFLKVKSNPQVITASLDFYFKGCSLHSIQDHLAQFYDVHVSHVAVLKWIRKYTRMMKEFTDRLAPNASGVWHVDEMMVKVKRTRPMKVGNPAKEEHYAWLWNLMDRETRFLLASQIHKKREVADARLVFAEGKAIARTTPLAVVHDGLTSYDDAFNKEFYRNRKPQVTNIRSIGATKHGRNQHVERLNGTIRDREKSMRGMYSDTSAQSLMDGNGIYYNFIRPHMALGGKTPAEEAEVDFGLEGNRWNALITQSYTAMRKRNEIVG